MSEGRVRAERQGGGQIGPGLGGDGEDFVLQGSGSQGRVTFLLRYNSDTIPFTCCQYRVQCNWCAVQPPLQSHLRVLPSPQNIVWDPLAATLCHQQRSFPLLSSIPLPGYITVCLFIKGHLGCFWLFCIMLL